jgi:site-specific DNA-methyltransferase (adenine-specific)
MDIINLKIEDLQPYEHNARHHEEKDLEAIEASIREFGFNDPIGIWGEKNIIVEGHGRLMAAKNIGLQEVPCIRLDHLTDEQRRAYALAHNKTAELSRWDFDVLDAELAGIEELDMSAFGFDQTQPEDPDDIVEDIPPDEDEVEGRCERGQVWQLGEHRLMCGDSTSAEDMVLLFQNDRPVFVFTDPPYGVSIGTKNKTINAIDPGRGGNVETDIENDTIPPDELYEILVKAMSNLRKHCAEDASYYVSAPQGGELGKMMLQMMEDAGLQVRHNLIWVKNAPTFSMGRLDYDYRHEPIFYTWTKSHKFYGDYSNSVIDDTLDINHMSKAELKDALRAYIEKKETSVIYQDKPLHSTLHPTMKPVKLVARFMINSSRPGDIVADIFGGSGTTIIAAEQLGRKARMMELDPHYCDVIITRWEEFTGKEARLINGAGEVEEKDQGSLAEGRNI